MLIFIVPVLLAVMVFVEDFLAPAVEKVPTFLAIFSEEA